MSQEILNGAQISALQKQVMERLHSANLDIELRKLALKSAMQMLAETPASYELVIQYARSIHRFLSAPVEEIKLTVTRQD